jgi:hypothetical protein
MLETADVTRQFLQATIRIIGRKTSEEYATVTVRNLLKKLQLTYSFLRDIELRDTRFLELESSVTVRESLNSVDPKLAGNALKDLVKIIMKSMGKTAGYFFIREIQEKIGTDYNTVLVKTMDVDLAQLQSSYIVEKKSVDLLQVEKSDVIRRLLKTVLELLEKQTSKTFAIEFIARRVDALRQHYPFFEYIKVNDIRYSLGVAEVVIQPEINTINSQDLGRALQSLLNEIDKTLTDLGRASVVDDLKTHLTNQYLQKLEEMGVTIAIHGVGYDAIFKQIIKALIDVLGKASTETYAIFAVNSFLRKTDSTFEFLKYVKINPAIDQGDVYHITIMNTFDAITETDARRAIQQLLETIVDSLGENMGNQFIQEFKNALEKRYLSRIEEMGVNLHLIELHQEMLAQTEQKSFESKKFV